MSHPNVKGLGNSIHLGTLNGTDYFALTFTTHVEGPSSEILRYLPNRKMTVSRSTVSKVTGQRLTLTVFPSWRLVGPV